MSNLTDFTDISPNSKLKVTIPNSCGNAPRQEILLVLTSAFAAHDAEAIDAALISDQVTWELAGSHSMLGKQTLLDHFQQVWPAGIEELIIRHIITHGKTASVNGELVMKDGSLLSFCDVYVFSSASNKGKISGITSYRVLN